MDLLVAVPVRLLPAFPLFDFRGVLELLFGDVHAVSAELLIVVQHRPGNRIMVRADAEKASETQDRVGDAAVGFIDHKALDLPDALTVRVIDRSSFDAVACDQGGCSSTEAKWSNWPRSFAVESLRAADTPCERSPCADSDEVARV